MRGYELTERGKIAVVVVVALILFIIVSVILTVNAISDKPYEPSQTDDPAVSGAPPGTETIPSDDTPSPPPNGGGFSPQGTGDEPPQTSADINDPETIGSPEPPSAPGDPLPPAGSEQNVDAAEPPDTSPYDNASPAVTDTEPSAADAAPHGDTADPANTAAPVSGGSFTFLFNTDAQDAIDSETIAGMGNFLTLPGNTADSVIAVETDTLTLLNAQKLMSAVTRAFAEYGISGRRVAHVIRGTAAGGGAIEVLLYYIPASVK